MDREAIIKSLALFVLLAATSIWAYTDFGEPYVAIIACLVQFVFVHYERKNSKQRKERKYSEVVNMIKNSVVFDNIKGNKNTKIYISTFPSAKEQSLDYQKIKDSYLKFISSPNDQLVNLKSQLEYDFSIDPNQLHLLHPSIRELYEKVSNSINLIKNKGLIIIIIGMAVYLCTFLLNIDILKTIVEIIKSFIINN